VDGARAAHLSGQRLAQPDARDRVGLHAFDPDGEAVDGRADVSADARRARPRDAGVGSIEALLRPNQHTGQAR
jgi:hypothetical protein